MNTIPAWLGALGVMFAIATALGASVAVYRTSVQGTSLKAARDIIFDLRGEITDHERREASLERDIKLLRSEIKAYSDRIHILEDLVTGRQHEDGMRQEIASIRDTVDKSIGRQLDVILGILQESKAL